MSGISVTRERGRSSASARASVFISCGVILPGLPDLAADAFRISPVCSVTFFESGPSPDAYSLTRRSNCAFNATIIVLADISTAPTAGVNTTPHGASTPAASGIATML